MSGKRKTEFFFGIRPQIALESIIILRRLLPADAYERRGQ
jgi:hypothetical protein